MAYYNEINERCAERLRERAALGLIPSGVIDVRSIVDVSPEDVSGEHQCHWFAGGGGWALAASYAGWPEEWPIWTASPPCQPFSVAGLRRGKRDERHLAPVWLDLVRECLPPVVFVEQVASAVTKDNWLDDLLDALGECGYSVGTAVLPACGVGSPHIRFRLWVSGVRMADCNFQRLEGRENMQERTDQLHTGENSLVNAGARGQIFDYPRWSDTGLIYCTDGVWRPFEPGILPVADGVPDRVELISEYGNAIVPQVAAEVIAATKEFIDLHHDAGE